MAVDFQVVFPSNTIPLSNVARVPGVFPPTLEIVGQDFRAVDEVKINGEVSPQVVVLSSTKLLAQIPGDGLDRITSVLVLSSIVTLSERNLLKFRLGRATQRTTGILKLMQLFIKLLFTTPGFDIWSPALGGGGLSAIGRSFDKSSGKGIVGEFMIAVDRTQQQIIATQTGDARLPPDERLLKATLLGVKYDRNQGALLPQIELISQTGVPALANIVL